MEYCSVGTVTMLYNLVKTILAAENVQRKKSN